MHMRRPYSPDNDVFRAEDDDFGGRTGSVCQRGGPKPSSCKKSRHDGEGGEGGDGKGGEGGEGGDAMANIDVPPLHVTAVPLCPPSPYLMTTQNSHPTGSDWQDDARLKK